MRYQTFISGQALPRSRAAADRGPQPSSHATRGHDTTPEANAPRTHRLVPLIQVISQSPPRVEEALQLVCRWAYQKGYSLPDTCKEVYKRARELGYEAILNVQEIASTTMPSFPDRTVMSALILVDLQPVVAGKRTFRHTYDRA